MRTIFVAGISGAGQSQAIKTFEDLGFYCVEHLPAIALDGTLDALERAGCSDAAIALDVRSDGRLGDPLAEIDRAMRDRGARLLFLDAQDFALIRRFSETRRRHPQHAGSIREAIDADRRALAPLRERASAVIDTTDLTHATLKERIAVAFAPDRTVRLAVTVVAFGFKYGLPTDLDLLFDVRFLRNPNYVPSLAPLTGNDADVAAFIDEDPSLAPFLERTGDLLAFLIPRYVAEGKAQLTVGVGCTGGRHRSVYVARRIADLLARDPSVELAFEARDVSR